MLEPNKKIVQAWRSSDWPAEHYSHTTFLMKAIKGGTRLTFTQLGVPDNQYESIKKGWITYYWTPMKEMLNKR